MELLKEAAPNITHVAFMLSADNLGLPGVGYPQSIETAARALSVQVVTMPVSDADNTQAAIKVFAGEPNGGIVASPGVDAMAPDELIRLAAKYRLPSVSGSPSFAANGGLMSYSADRGELIRGAATYLDRLVRGAKISCPYRKPKTAVDHRRIG